MFALADFGDWQNREQVLFDKYSMQGHPAPKREAGKSIAGTIGARTGLSSGAQDAMNGHMISSYCMATGQGNAEIGFDVDPTLNCNHEAPISFGIQSTIIGREDKNGGNGMGICEEIAPTLTKADQHGIAVVHGTQDPCISDIAFALGRNNGQENALIEHSQVRRLTPVECARLQGFPDTYLDIQYRNRAACDGPKYKALGNSFAVPVIKWIGKRIQMIEKI